MCTPILLFATAAVATIAASSVSASAQQKSAAVQATAIEQQGQAQANIAEYNAQATENAAEYNANVIEENAVMYEEAAVDSVARGVEEAAAKRAEFKQSNARGRAALASGGTTLDTGTNLELLVNNAGFGEINALAAVNNAEREAYGYKRQETSERNRAEGVRYTGDLEAGSQRASGQAGLISSQYSADATRYAGDLGARTTMAGGIANAVNLFPTFFRSGGGFGGDS